MKYTGLYRCVFCDALVSGSDAMMRHLKSCGEEKGKR